MDETIRTWHHGLVARWWAEFNRGGDDVDFFRGAVAAHGEPALDAGCGTGRLLLPMRAAGLDVDGSDASGDMLDWCRRGAGAAGLPVTLYPQAMHELELPRRYRTIFVCGAFGLGGTRAQDLEGLRRLRRHLLPGGRLLMDHYLPNLEGARSWRDWIERPELPKPWSRGDRRVCDDGSELELSRRIVAFDPLEQTTTQELRVRHSAADRPPAEETHRIDICLYFKNEIELMLSAAGFRCVAVTAFPETRAPRPWTDGRILFQASA